MSKEKSFFEKMASEASGGWDIMFSDHLQPGELYLGRYQARLYLVDTSNGWTAGGAMAAQNFEDARRMAQTAGIRPNDLLDMAGHVSTQLSKRRASSSDPDMIPAFQLIAATGTKTYQMVPPDERNGHWASVVYQGKDGSVISRPVYFGGDKPGLCSPEQLEQMTRQVVAHDMRPGTAVYEAMRQAGGVRLAPKLRACRERIAHAVRSDLAGVRLPRTSDAWISPHPGRRHEAGRTASRLPTLAPAGKRPGAVAQDLGGLRTGDLGLRHVPPCQRAGVEPVLAGARRKRGVAVPRLAGH